MVLTTPTGRLSLPGLWDDPEFRSTHVRGSGPDQVRLLVRSGPSQVANTFEVRDSGDVERFAVNPEDSVIVRVTDMDLVMTFAGSGITTITGGNVTADGALTATGANADQVQLIVRGNSGQSASLQEWRDSADSVLSSISASGGAVLFSASISNDLLLASDAGLLKFGAAQDVVLARDAANVLALRNGTDSQSFRVYQGISGADSSYLEISKPAGNVVAIIPNQTGAGVGAPYNLFISGKTNAVAPFNGVLLDSSGSTMTIAGLAVSHKASVLNGSVAWTFNNTNDAQYAAFVVDAADFAIRVPTTTRFVINNNGVTNNFDWRNGAGAVVLTLTPESPASLDMLGFITATPPSYSAAGSRQGMAADLTLGAGAGKNVSDTAFLAGVMGNIFGASLTKTGNYLGGVIGHYSITGAGASTYQKGAVLAGISDGSTDADGAVVAYIDGDSGAATTAGAAFKVRHNNSTSGNFFSFGLDLFDAAHDGFNAVSYLKGEIRLLTEAVIFTGSGAPTDGVSGTGAGFASKGSLYIDTSTGEAYLNTGTKASPTWKQITHAA